MSSSRIVVDLKRKRSGQFTISSTRAVDVQNPQRCSPSSSIPNLCKRRELDGSTNNYSNCSFPSGKRLIKCYSNFKKSNILQRLMYYYNGEWNDFPQDIVDYVNKDFAIKNGAVEVEFNGNEILLDFLRMMQLDMNTGLHQPIAWIDVSGKCFFPEIYSDYDEPHLGGEKQGSNDIKLLLEIKMHEPGGEPSGESNPIFISADPENVPIDPDAGEPALGNENKVGIPESSTGCEGPQAEVLGGTCQVRSAKSPSIPFPMLFTAIADRVTSENMDILKSDYALFRDKKISRGAFVTKLKMIVGDDLLKSTITSFQSKSSDVETGCT